MLCLLGHKKSFSFSIKSKKTLNPYDRSLWRSADTCRTTSSAWCFPSEAPEAADETAATLETKNKQTQTRKINTGTTNSDLGPQILYQLWKWKKLDTSLNVRQESSETENYTISACCSRVLFVIDKQPVMYRWFSDTIVTPVGLNFNCTVGAHLKVFPYSLLLCSCRCYDSPVLRPTWKPQVIFSSSSRNPIGRVRMWGVPSGGASVV